MSAVFGIIKLSFREVITMRENHLWNRAKALQIQTGPDIVGGFDVGFDPKIPEETRDVLMRFVYWVEDHFSMPVTLWVDFKYNHYLIGRTGKRVSYRFYWAECKPFPRFENEADIPVIELPVRTEHLAMEEILLSFIRAISMYYAWLTGAEMHTFEADASEAEEVLAAWLRVAAE